MKAWWLEISVVGGVVVQFFLSSFYLTQNASHYSPFNSSHLRGQYIMGSLAVYTFITISHIEKIIFLVIVLERKWGGRKYHKYEEKSEVAVFNSNSSTLLWFTLSPFYRWERKDRRNINLPWEVNKLLKYFLYLINIYSSVFLLAYCISTAFNLGPTRTTLSKINWCWQNWSSSRFCVLHWNPLIWLLARSTLLDNSHSQPFF